MMRFSRVFLPIFCAATLLSACDSGDAPAPDTATVSDPTHLTRGIQAEPGTLDPHKSIMTDEWAVLRDLYMGLTYPGPDGRPGPGVAESWQVSEDGLTYTFTLRPDAAWSSGNAVVAEDFVRGLRRLFDPATASPAAPLLYEVENARAVNRGELPPEALGVAAPDAATVVVTLERPTPNLPEMLAMPFAAPRPDGPAENIFNGPYVVSERIADTVIRLERNPAFRGPAMPAINRVSYLPTPDDETAMRLYQSGQLDLHPWYPSDRREWLDENFPGHAASGPALGVSYLVFNTTQPPFDKRDVRRALALVVDSRLIAERVLENAVDSATRFVPGAVRNYAGPAIDTRSQKDRTAAAQALLAGAGYTADAPLSFELRVRQSDDDRKVATALQAFWREIGVGANIVTSDLKTHFDDLETGRFSVADAGWALFNAPESFLFLLSPDDAAQLNYGQYDSPDFIAAYEAALAETGADARAAKFAEAERIALDDAAVVPLYHYRTRAMVRPSVQGFVLNPAAINPSLYLSKSGVPGS